MTKRSEKNAQLVPPIAMEKIRGQGSPIIDLRIQNQNSSSPLNRKSVMMPSPVSSMDRDLSLAERMNKVV